MLSHKIKIMADSSAVSTAGSINTTANASPRLLKFYSKINYLAISKMKHGDA